MKKGLYILATPIGNLQDISQRGLEVLKEAEIIACEDTRVTKKLLSLLGISHKKQFIPLHDHNEETAAEELISTIEQGRAVVLVSDAGSPLISDPGYKLVNKCREKNIEITAIPGACAIICALQLSGLPTNRFMFAGFIPNREKARKDLFEELKNIDTTLVFYETAPRILKSLEAAKTVFKSRKASVAREITKRYEECLTDSIDNLISHFEQKEPKGEMVLMIAPPEEIEKPDMEKILKRKLKTNPLKTAVKEAVEEFGFNKNDAYDLALRLKK